MSEKLGDVVYAPWTDDQIKNINDYQVSGIFHEYTCFACRPGVLVATSSGWVCPACGWSDQKWASTWMANGEWRKWEHVYPRKPEGVSLDKNNARL